MKVVIQRRLEGARNTIARHINRVYDVELEVVEGGASRLRAVRAINDPYNPNERLPILHKGFFDSHLHAIWMGLRSHELDLSACRSPEELIARVEERFDTGAKVVVGHGWDESTLGLSLATLGASFENKLPEGRPVILYRVCGHAALVNRSLRNAARRAQWGVYLTDRDLVVLNEHLPLPTVEDCQNAFLESQKKLLAKGISAIGEMCLDETGISALRGLATSNRLSIDVQGVLLAGAAPSVENAGPFAIESGDTSVLGRAPVASVRHWKKFLDGSLGSRTALLSSPYADAEVFGDRLEEMPALLKSAREALLNGFHLSFHAIGDGALDQALDLGTALFDQMQSRRTLESSVVLPQSRHRIEHAQIVRDDQVEKLRSQDLWILCMQPGHRVSDQHFIRARLGDDRYLKQAYRCASLVREGLAVALSSDAPIDVYDPLQVLKAAMTHENPAERLSFDEAMWLYTTGGRLEAGLDPGKLALGSLVFTTDPENIL